MTLIQIKYVTKGAQQHEHIQLLGTDVVSFKLDGLIGLIEGGQYGFFTEHAGQRAMIRVRQGLTRKYVQTIADGVWQNNLLSLPPCKVAA